MELHLFVNWERENLYLARQRSAVMAFIPDHPMQCLGLYYTDLHSSRFKSTSINLYPL